MNCLVLQPFGLGDCIFAQGIPKMLGYDNVIWPVNDQYIDDLKRAYPAITWVKENFSDFKHPYWWNETICTLPIRWSDTLMTVPYERVMRAKYDMYSLDYRIWSDHAGWRRDAEKEAELMELLSVKPGYKFNLISQNFSGKFRSNPINIGNGLQNIYLNPIQGYSLFDWAGVIERATEIHMVSSSGLYLLECLSPQAERICVYQRSAQEEHNRYDYLFKKHKYNWI